MKNDKKIIKAKRNPNERIVMPDFEREVRYMVFKLTDVDKYLDDDMTKLLHYIGRTLHERRILDWKEPIACVVVEHDWPEYEPTWQAIEARMTEMSKENKHEE